MTKRIIKFRAWEPKAKKMHYGKDDMVALVHALKLMEMPDEMEWMQFTGLHDKNGKEIYEGDVVRITGTRTDWLGQDSEGRHEYSEPKPFENVIEVKDMRFEWDITCNDPVCEVLGNIYENPELLKEPNENA